MHEGTFKITHVDPKFELFLWVALSSFRPHWTFPC